MELVRQPPYIQLIQLYRDDIRSGRLKEGDPLPTARQLAAEHNVALNTAAKIVEGLRALGLATTVVGVGSFVAIQPGALDEPTAPLTREILRDAGQAVVAEKAIVAGGSTQAVDVAIMPAPKHVISHLGLPPQAPVIRRHQLTTRDGKIQASAISWFPAGLADTLPELLGSEPVAAAPAGLKVARGSDRVTARSATPADAAALGIQPGTPVLAVRRRTNDATGNALMYTEIIARADEELAFEYPIARR